MLKNIKKHLIYYGYGVIMQIHTRLGVGSGCPLLI